MSLDIFKIFGFLNQFTLTQMDEAEYYYKGQRRHFEEGYSVDNFESEVRVDCYQTKDHT